MNPQLTQYTIKNMLEDTGDDYIFLHVFFKTDTRSETSSPLLVAYVDLQRFIATINEPAYNYLSKIRSNIQGYGPKHSKVFKVIEAENFDLEPYIKKYIASLTDLFVEQHYEWCDRISNPENVEKATEAFEKINQVVSSDYRHDVIKADEFIDEVDQTLHELTLKYFPELFEKEEKYIDAYIDILFRTTMNFYKSIDKLRHKN